MIVAGGFYPKLCRQDSRVLELVGSTAASPIMALLSGRVAGIEYVRPDGNCFVYRLDFRRPAKRVVQACPRWIAHLTRSCFVGSWFIEQLIRCFFEAACVPLWTSEGH